MDSVSWGIIGCGDVCELKSGPAFGKVDGSSLAAVCRRSPGAAREYADRHGVAHAFESAEELVACAEVTAVYVASPPGRHLEHALLALAAKKPTYVEKPLARNAAEAEQMVAAFAAAGVPLFSAYYRRAQAPFLRARELVASGELGAPVSASYRGASDHSAEPGPRVAAAAGDDAATRAKGYWQRDAALSGGGLILDVGVHALDIMAFILGDEIDASTVSGSAKNAGTPWTPVEDTVAMSFRFAKSKLPATACWNFCDAKREDELLIKCANGSVSMPVFGWQLAVTKEGGKPTQEDFEKPEHVQQPMIELIVANLKAGGVKTFGAGAPSYGENALSVARAVDAALGEYYGERKGSFWEAPEAWPKSAGSVPPGKVRAIAITDTEKWEGVKGKKDYTVYKLECTCIQDGGIETHTLVKRYSAFEGLRDELLKQKGLSGDAAAAIEAVKRLTFPPKKLFGSMSDETIAERRQILTPWMNQALVILGGAGPGGDMAIQRFLAGDGSDMDYALSLVPQIREALEAARVEGDDLAQFSDEYLAAVMAAPGRSFAYACDKLLGVLKWQREFGMAELVAESNAERMAALHKCAERGPLYWRGHTKAGHPILWVRPSLKLQPLDLAAELDMHVYLIQKAINEYMPAGVFRLSVIAEAGVGSGASTDLMKALVELLQVAYPDKVDQIRVGPVTSGLQMLYSMLSPLIPPATKSKIFLMGDPAAQIVESGAVDADKVPAHFGGPCEHFAPKVKNTGASESELGEGGDAGGPPFDMALMLKAMAADTLAWTPIEEL